MSIFRLLVAWLVLAALPLQGMAAASMLFCDQAAAAVAVAEAHGGHADHDHDRRQVSAHDGHDGHAADQDAAGSGHGDHKCPICALCQVVAIPETTSVVPSADPPSADLPQPRALALTRAPPRPDKPPRA